MESTMNTETTFNFTITGRSLASRYAEVDVTSVYGAAGREPMTLAEITDLVGLTPENSPVVWEDSPYGGQFGTFTSPVDPDNDELGTYSITLEEATA
jgi:hypothetical protein